MTSQQIASNPFALMMDPDAVFAALARSDRLERLKSRVCRPLDKPLGAAPGDDETTAAEGFDGQADAATQDVDTVDLE